MYEVVIKFWETQFKICTLYSLFSALVFIQSRLISKQFAFPSFSNYLSYIYSITKVWKFIPFPLEHIFYFLVAFHLIFQWTLLFYAYNDDLLYPLRSQWQVASNKNIVNYGRKVAAILQMKGIETITKKQATISYVSTHNQAFSSNFFSCLSHADTSGKCKLSINHKKLWKFQRKRKEHDELMNTYVCKCMVERITHRKDGYHKWRERLSKVTESAYVYS